MLHTEQPACTFTFHPDGFVRKDIRGYYAVIGFECQAAHLTGAPEWSPQTRNWISACEACARRLGLEW